jgi:hypothetical protein
MQKNSAKSLGHASSACKYVVPSFVFKERESGLVFFGHKQKTACVLI